jgi:transcriptional regulator with XRE-family HTH domain
MDFFEKITKLVQLKNKSELSRLAGLPPTAIDAIINKRREPLATKAIRVARALDVPAEWLFDDRADWPPPSAGQQANELGDSQLVDELCRRRHLIFQDHQRLAARLIEPALMKKIEKLSGLAYVPDGFRKLVFADQEAFKSYYLDMQRLRFLEVQLNLLDPEKVRPIGGLQSGDQLFANVPNLLRDWQFTGRPGEHGSLTRDYKSGEITPIAGGEGQIITSRQYEEIGAILQRRFVPIIEDPENGPPPEKPILIDEGQSAPSRYRQFIQFPAENQQSFGFKLTSDNMSPTFPKGCIVVCVPGDPDRTGGVPCLVCPTGKKTLGLYLVKDNELVSSSAKAAPIKLKRGDSIEYFPVIGGPFPP